MATKSKIESIAMKSNIPKPNSSYSGISCHYNRTKFWKGTLAVGIYHLPILCSLGVSHSIILGWLYGITHQLCNASWGRGTYIVQLSNAREFSGQQLSAINKRFFSLGASLNSVKHVYECLYANKYMFPSPKCLIFHLPFVYLRELCANWCI